ncbi:MAG: hypothetical protein KAS21_01565 [Candidatus Aminicenantes bacterium]|nr:hypothetical protein [Candidatus Aminicenantes bacterium]
MIKKEFKDIIKPTALRIVTGVLIIFLFYTALRLFGGREAPFFADIIYLYDVLFWLIIVWVSFNLGINMFKKEQTDYAMEYLISSPLSKPEIFIKKISPRLIILFLLVLFYFMLQNLHIFLSIEKSRHIIGFSGVIIITFTVFLCSAFLSIYEWGDFKALVWLIITFPGYHLSLLLDNFLHLNVVSDDSILVSIGLINLSLMIITIILGIGFYFSYRNFDVRAQKIFKNKFSLISGIPLILIILTSLIIGISKNI